MSDRPSKPPSMDDLVAEMKADRGPTPDWSAIDDELFAQIEIEAHRAQSDPPAERSGGRVVWIGASVALAAAAAALLLVHPSSEDIDAQATATVSAGAFVGGGADVAIGSVNAASGQSLSQNASIDVRSGTAYFEQAGAVRWTASGGSSLHVEHAASPLVLSLERGAAEAQVTPVPMGEAFAIDVTSSTGAVVRVAVHGTHLRVARDGDKIVVDLNEGVVSIGAPPRRGSTIGSLVTAPAHVELDARDPVGTMRVDHDGALVRPAETVSPPIVAAEKEATQPVVLAQASGTSAGEVVAPTHPTNAQKLSTSHAPSAPLAAPEPAQRSPDDIASAVKVCIADASATRPDLSATVTSTLTLFVDDAGTVQRAHFFPPLAPQADLQDCVAHAVYQRVPVSRSGDVVIPILVKR